MGQLIFLLQKEVLHLQIYSPMASNIDFLLRPLSADPASITNLPATCNP